MHSFATQIHVVPGLRTNQASGGTARRVGTALCLLACPRVRTQAGQDGKLSGVCFPCPVGNCSCAGLALPLPTQSQDRKGKSMHGIP